MVPAPPPTVPQPPCEVLHATAADYATPDTFPRALHLWKPKAEARARHSISGRALLNRKGKVGSNYRQEAPHRDGAAKAVAGMLGWLWVVVDSGCSWHCHYRREDLINLRPCGDTMTGVDGKPQRVTHIGDMPAMARDRDGKLVQILIRDVRLVPTFSDTLLSVDQFFEQDNKVRTYFNDDRYLLLNKGAPDQLKLPFSRRSRLYQMALLPIATLPSNGGGNKVEPSTSVPPRRAMKATIHGPKTTSHVEALSPDRMLDTLHRRLHIGFDTIRKLGTITADVPSNISKGLAHSCPSCKEANAAHLPHTGKGYTPSAPGRTIHADIAGPFVTSAHGHYKYFMVCVDDHSRFKQVYFLTKKSHAIKRIRTFVAQFKATRTTAAPHVIGTLHSDNAGEFLSHEFKE